MNLQQATSDIDYVLRRGRIILPEGSPTAEEHTELRNDFNLLVKQAQLANELGKKIATLKSSIKVLEGRLEKAVTKETGPATETDTDTDGNKNE